MSLNPENYTRHTDPLKNPVYVVGKVKKGFQRGRELNCRTANVDPRSFTKELLQLKKGVFWCFAKRAKESKIHPAVTSFGNNPTFENNPLTLEVHILHEYDDEFYDEQLQVLIVGYMRPMWKFVSLDKLVDWIEDDKEFAKLRCQESNGFEKFFTNTSKALL